MPYYDAIYDKILPFGNRQNADMCRKVLDVCAEIHGDMSWHMTVTWLDICQQQAQKHSQTGSQVVNHTGACNMPSPTSSMESHRRCILL